ncbi:contact-dependent growth inhibition system immunity protein [Streptomyces sp. NPDC059819]|uniref:contact-dependent growth inhibition system immunity protein n=1 Tax=Streptomyces sp. NPDC059819 TaxID=3346963 RepID=UPI003653A7EA
MATVRELRGQPIGGLSVEAMRLLIRQNVGLASLLASLLPLAAEVLRVDPLAEGDVYEGDLLAAVLTRDAEVWSESPELRPQVHLMVSELSVVPPALKREVEEFLALLGRRQPAVSDGPAVYEGGLTSGRGPERVAPWPRVSRRTMMPIMAQRIMVSEWAGLVS